MTTEREVLSRFREAFLDYLEGERDDPPLVDDLAPEHRPAAEAYLESIAAAHGIDPFASTPSIEQLLAVSLRSPDHTWEFGDHLERHLQQTVDPNASVEPDAAAAAMQLASTLVIGVQGIRIRVVPERSGQELRTALPARAGDIAGVFRAFPDCHAVLYSTMGTRPRAVVLDRSDAQAAVETPSGEIRAPRLRRPVDDAGAACESWLKHIVPVFQPLGAESRHDYDASLASLEPSNLAREAIEHVRSAGSRARIEAKQTAWRDFGAWETERLSELLVEARRSPMSEADYRSWIDELAEAAA